MEVARKLGRRHSAYVTYLEPILLTRKNLKLIKFANVTRVLFSRDQKEKRAIGVEYTRHGYKFKAYASKEVIISAGSFGSPMVLFKSGIGPFQILKAAGVSLCIIIFLSIRHIM